MISSKCKYNQRTSMLNRIYKIMSIEKDEPKLIQVLDHGFVRFIDSMGDDLSIVRNARVSYNAAWRAGEDTGSDARLINYLLNNGHNTPFESVTLQFEVKAPIFVFRQWHRHRTQSYNEVSARYKELPSEYYVPDPQVMGQQAKGNKQCRNIEPLNAEEYENALTNHAMIADHCASAFAMYEDLLENGVPRELARSVLPVCTYSHMFVTVNLHNLFGFLRERLHTHAQYEIRVYAQALLEFIKPIVPVAAEAFINQLKQKEGYDL